MYRVVHASERSIFQYNMPTAEAIEEALRRAVRGVPGQWVGPLARVTRRAIVGDGFFTFVTWVFEESGPPTATLRERVDAALREVSSDFTPTAVWDFAEAANGPIAWWRSGAAANESRSRYAAPTMTARLDSDDNPIGPTTAANAPTSPSDILGGGGGTRDAGLARTIQLAAGAVIVVGVAGLVVTYIPPEIMPWNWGREDRERKARRAREEEDRERREREEAEARRSAERRLGGRELAG